jgi:hypothetical protein
LAWRYEPKIVPCSFVVGEGPTLQRRSRSRFLYGRPLLRDASTGKTLQEAAKEFVSLGRGKFVVHAVDSSRAEGHHREHASSDFRGLMPSSVAARPAF